MVLLAVVVGLAGAEVAYVAFRYHQIHRRLAPPSRHAPRPRARTWACRRSCSSGRHRAACSTASRARPSEAARHGITGVNSDVILLLRADQITHSVSILSIPRDLAMNNVRPGQFYKIDAALADGPDQLVAAIEQNFGIPINHFVELNFDSFQSIVTALGGLKMYFPYRVSDDSSGLHIRTTGCVYLDGFNALALVRARNYYYYKDGQWIEDGSGDLGRIIRVHEFLRVLATAVSKRGIGNVLTDNSLLGAVAPDLEIDSKLSLSDMVDLLTTFHSIDIATVPELTMPNIENFADYYYEGYDFGSVVLPTYPQDQQAIDKFLGLKRPPASAVAPGKVTVWVTNGSGVAGQGTTTANQLSSLGFHVVGIGSAASVGPISETVVYYKPGDLLDAERVIENIHGIVAMAQESTTSGADVNVVTGSDYSVQLQHAKATTTTTSTTPTTSTATSTTTTSTSTTSTSTTTTTTTQPSSLGPPSAAVQALPSYDPRACPSS